MRLLSLFQLRSLRDIGVTHDPTLERCLKRAGCLFPARFNGIALGDGLGDIAERHDKAAVLICPAQTGRDKQIRT